MGVRFRDRLTPEGQRFFRELAELKALEVRVGFQRMEADGQGKYDGKKIYAKGGVKDKAGRVVDSDIYMVDIAAYNELGTEHIPARPFIRQSVDDNSSRISSFLKGQVKDFAKGKSAEQVLKDIGIFQKDLMQDKIKSGDFVPDADSTIKKKGSSKPLVDTGRMRQSVNYVIQKKGSGDD